jgi:hypothetical protein
MTTSYKVLCSVVMQHSYFTDGQLRELEVRPTASTAARLRQAGLLIKHQPSGFVLLYASSSAASQSPRRLHKVPAPVFPLVFSLTPHDPYFLNYSDLPLLKAPGYVYCLGTWAGPASRSLQAGPVVAGGDQLLLRPLVFEIPVVAGAIELRPYPVGDSIAPLEGPANATSLTFDVRRWGSGRYQLQIGTEEPEVFYADADLAAARPWGLLGLEATVLDGDPAPCYSLCFGARSTVWQYQLVGRRPLPARLTIETNTPGLHFAQVAPAPAGVQLTFRASTAQPLAQRYAGLYYQLVLPPAAGSSAPPTILHPALPHAGPEGTLSKNINNNILMVNDIFVQL